MKRLLLLSFVLTVSTCASTVRAGGQPPTHLTRLTLQLKWLPQAQFAGYFVAQDLGFYRRQGLDVSIIPGGPTITPETQVREGVANIGVDWLPALLVARDHGENLTNIAQVFQASGMRLITFRSTDIRGIAPSCCDRPSMSTRFQRSTTLPS